mmetsp:Transcript_51601/g.120376  ORF Transcript_51601/g.120376 Transcript_51601/m.120376 type:complete len:656 (+) Transcript_51601:82-2049(+)
MKSAIRTGILSAVVSFSQELAEELCFDGVCRGVVDSDPAQMRFELLQHRVESFRSRNTSAALVQEGTPALIAEIYTFGAPAVSRPAMPDLSQKDHCFRGLRTFTENKWPGGGRQVDAASCFDAYAHPIISTLALDWGQDSLYVPCPGEVAWPYGGASSWGLHSETHYAPRLQEVTIEGRKVKDEEPFATANKMVTLAYKSYDSVENTKKELKEKLPDWHLIDRHVFEWTSGAYDDDPVLIAQNKQNLDCALIFTGTNHFGELGSSVKQHLTGYCGFDQVHAGYRDEVWQLSDHAIWPMITGKLAKCRRVICVGHSLGGAVCDVFAGCINSRRSDDPDYKKLMWLQGPPTLMPEIGSAEEAAELGATGGAGLGYIDALYTYGAPACCDPPLEDKKAANGCFKGLRVYTENDLAGGGKQVDARAFSNNFFPHPHMDVLSLQWDRDSHYERCKKEGSDGFWWPHHNAMMYEDWYLHSEKNYVDRLKQLCGKFPQNQLYAEALKFVYLAFAGEKSLEHLLPGMKSEMPGWNLVAFETLLDDNEKLLLAQDQETFDCAMVFPGNWADRKKTYGTEFCGMKNVHHGYRNYLVESVQTENFMKVKALLPKCRRLILTGHSRGATMGELFAGCLNNGDLTDQDFRRIMWTEGTPEALPALTAR